MLLNERDENCGNDGGDDDNDDDCDGDGDGRRKEWITVIDC